MDSKVTRALLPLAAVAATAVMDTSAWAVSGPSLAGRPAFAACRTGAVPRPDAEPAPETPEDSAAPSPYTSLEVALSARARGGTGLVDYRVDAHAVHGEPGLVTVTVYLTCVPGDAGFAGRAVASSGTVTAGRDALTWRLGLGHGASASAGFTVRVTRPGTLVGELAVSGSNSNCPADTGGEAGQDCRATVVIPARETAARPPAAGPAHAAPAMPVVPAMPAATPGAQPAQRLPEAPPPLPVPLPALPTGPIPAPSASPSPVLSQANRKPVIASDPPAPDAAAQQDAQDAVARSVLRSAHSEDGDLSGRAFAFLLGGAAFLMLVAAIAGSVVGARLRRRPRTEKGEGA
jgi:hypothetical protein